MPEILFVDVQDRSGDNRSLIRRHAAEDAHRRKRLEEVFRYQTQASLQWPISLRPRQPPQEDLQDGVPGKDEGAENDQQQSISRQPRKYSPPRVRHRRPTRDPKTAMTLRWRVFNPTAIRPPADDMKIELILSESFNWMLGQYTSSWSSLVKRDPNVFDHNMEVEILREAFYVVTDLLEVQKTAAAFTVLGHTLDAVPGMFREPHPELLFTLVELAYGINMVGATELHAKIRPHVAALANTIMGPKHPLTILLKSEFDVNLKAHVTELVFKCIIDAMSKTFGKTAYQTLVQQMGRSQFYARTGRSEEGQRIITEIRNHWDHQYGAESALVRLAELELCLMRLQQRPDIAAQAQANNAMLRIEVMAGVYSNKFTSRMSKPEQNLHQPPSKMALVQWFLQNKRYSFALKCFEYAKRKDRADATTVHLQRPLANLIIETVTEALSESLQQSGLLSILPSQAPAQHNVLAVS